MYVRELNRHEVLPALHLVWEVFAEDVACCYTPEGVAEFQRFIKYENINRMHQTGELIMFGAFDAGELTGTISVRREGHICLFFVRGSCQGRGVGRMLFQAVLNYCAQRLRVSRITVNAAPNAVPKYLHMGMRRTAGEQLVNGMRYTPMEMYVNLPPVQQIQRHSPLPFLIVGAVIAVILFAILTFGGIVAVMRGVIRPSEDLDNWERHQEEWWDDDFFDDDYTSLPQESPEDEKTGLDGILPYAAENLSYEIEEDSYVFYDDEKQYTWIDFDVKYPKLTGLDSEAADRVNQIFRECALETVNKVYENPSEEMKEKVLKEEYPILVSYVDYKVCFASEDFLSVAFEDNSCQGNEEEYHQNLRTVNINLKDGKVYRLSELIDIDNSSFVKLWLERMREDEESGDAFSGRASSEYFSELSMEELKRTLAGDSLDGVYVVNFFLDKGGLNIGYDLNYKKGDIHDIGYTWLVTALEGEEIADYIRLPELWEWLWESGI